MDRPRRIKSFVLRAGRITAGQERALAELWPVYGLEFSATRIDLDAVFARAPAAAAAQRCLEIGFGTGEVIGSLAQIHPETDFLGIEVHRPGVGRLLLRAAAAQLTNLRVLCHDAVEVLDKGIDDASFDEVLVFFPDPWHKKRHHKRRLLDAGFVNLIADKMRAGGILRLATDWQDYAEQMRRVCNANPRLDSMSAEGGYVERPSLRPASRYERRGMRLGHAVWDLAYRRRRT